MFFAALAARGEQPFVAHRRGSALSRTADLYAKRSECPVSAFMSKSVWRSICHYRPKQYPLMLTGHNSLIHGGLLAQLKPVTIVAADAGRAPPSQCINDICRASSRSQNDPRSCAGKSVQGSHLARDRWSCGMTIERIGSSCTGPWRAAPDRGTAWTIHGIGV